MRPLIIGAAQRQVAQEVVTFARRPENWYRPGADRPPPGDNPAHICFFPLDVRCVFSYTLFEGKLYRHLSVSLPQGYPNPFAVRAITQLFGFTGGWDDWLVDPHNEGCVVVMQPIVHTIDGDKC